MEYTMAGLMEEKIYNYGLANIKIEIEKRINKYQEGIDSNCPKIKSYITRKKEAEAILGIIKYREIVEKEYWTALSRGEKVFYQDYVKSCSLSG